MRRPLGVNTWVWTSPLDDDGVVRLAAHVAAMGFEVLELPVEDVGDWDAQRAREVLAEHGLAVPRPAPASSPRWGGGRRCACLGWVHDRPRGDPARADRAR